MKHHIFDILGTVKRGLVMMGVCAGVVCMMACQPKETGPYLPKKPKRILLFGLRPGQRAVSKGLSEPICAFDDIRRLSLLI